MYLVASCEKKLFAFHGVEQVRLYFNKEGVHQLRASNTTE
jgi:hypothetical protein